MNNDNFNAMKNPANRMSHNSARARACHNALLLDRRADVSGADEIKARRIVNAVASLRILVPVAVITMMIASAHWKTPDVGGVITRAVESSTAVSGADAEYYPGKYVNQGRAAEDHVQNF
jgi:hypothetical protein